MDLQPVTPEPETLSGLEAALSAAGISETSTMKEPERAPEAPAAESVKASDLKAETQTDDDLEGPNAHMTTEKLSSTGRDTKPKIRGRKKEDIVEPAPDAAKVQQPEPGAEAGKALQDSKAPAPQADPDEIPDKEIDAIQEPVGLTPKKSADWKSLRKIAKESKRKYGEAVDYISRLHKDKGVLPKEVTSELEELRKFRALVDLRQDPQFKSKYDTRIEQNANTVYEILKAHGMKDDDIEIVKKHDAVRNYGKHADWWEKKVFEELRKNPASAKDGILLKKMLEENISLDWERERELQNNVGKLEEWQAEKQKVAQDKDQKDQAELQSVVQEWQKTLNIPWIKPMEVSSTATPEQKAQAIEHNKRYAEVEQRFTGVYNATNPSVSARNRAEIAGAVVLAFLQAEDIEKLSAERQGLIQELQKLKSAGTIASAGRATPASKPAPARSPFSFSDTDAIERGLQEALASKK